MKAFYRKESNQRIKEVVFYERMYVESDIVTMTIISSYVDEDDFKILSSATYPSKEVVESLIAKVEQHMTVVGWNASYEEVINNKYNTYPDGINVGTIIDKVIDSVEGLKFPVIVYAKPLGVHTHFNKEFRTTAVVSAALQLKALEVQEMLSTGFDCYLQDDKFIVSDVAVTNVNYNTRKNILSDIDEHVEVVEPTIIHSLAELNSFCEKHPNIIIREAKGMYLPGFSASFTYQYSEELYEDLIVVAQEGEQVVCINNNFDKVEVNKTASTLAETFTHKIYERIND